MTTSNANAIPLDHDPEHRVAHDHLHRVWTASVGTRGYVKEDWNALDNAIAKLARRAPSPAASPTYREWQERALAAEREVERLKMMVSQADPSNPSKGVSEDGSAGFVCEHAGRRAFVTLCSDGDVEVVVDINLLGIATPSTALRVKGPPLPEKMAPPDGLLARTFQHAHDLPSAMAAFNSAAQHGDENAAVYHAAQAFEFIPAMCRAIATLGEIAEIGWVVANGGATEKNADRLSNAFVSALERAHKDGIVPIKDSDVCGECRLGEGHAVTDSPRCPAVLAAIARYTLLGSRPTSPCSSCGKHVPWREEPILCTNCFLAKRGHRT